MHKETELKHKRGASLGMDIRLQCEGTAGVPQWHCYYMELLYKPHWLQPTSLCEYHTIQHCTNQFDFFFGVGVGEWGGG